jgi:mono/diheme cytochrome c family protein
MKMKLTITILTVASVIMMSCGGPKRKPGRTYMPDMTYSRAYESYPDLDSSVFTQNEAAAGSRIYYDRKPVPGTVKQGQMMVYHGSNDSTGIEYSKSVSNPLPDTSMTKADMDEAGRLYNIYCGICHGPNLDGKGPLVTAKKWAGAPANLMDVSQFGRTAYPDGQVFHTITYGKNTMGGYASQLNMKQRWMVVNYIRSKQKPKEKEAADAAAKKGNGGAVKDTSGAKVK